MEEKQDCVIVLKKEELEKILKQSKNCDKIISKKNLIGYTK